MGDSASSEAESARHGLTEQGGQLLALQASTTLGGGDARHTSAPLLGVMHCFTFSAERHKEPPAAEAALESPPRKAEAAFEPPPLINAPVLPSVQILGASCAGNSLNSG